MNGRKVQSNRGKEEKRKIVQKYQLSLGATVIIVKAVRIREERATFSH